VFTGSGALSVWNRLFGRASQARSVPRNRIRAKYDAAQTTNNNYRHWAQADSLAADAAASPSIRAILRSRGRYEAANNPYTDGQLQTLAADMIGRGPVLRMKTGDNRVDSHVESEFAEWAKAVRLAKKLRLCVESRAASGEVFIRLFGNEKLPTKVKLDLQVIEADQVSDPIANWQGDPLNEDGIVFDKFGNPVEYHVLKQHPGSGLLTSFASDVFIVPADDMLHFYKMRRPGQRRGIPQITSSLSLYADRRNYRQSVLEASRKAAEFGAVVLEGQSPANIDPDSDVPYVEAEPWDVMEITSGMMTTLPAGMRANQMKAEQPGTTFAEFDGRLICEGARPLNMPSNIARLDSSGYNYSSGRLDHQCYDRILDVDHQDIEDDLLDKIFKRWLREAMSLAGYMYVTTLATGPKHSWEWRPRAHVDEEKAARAQQMRLDSLCSSRTAELAQAGEDFEQHVATLQRERRIMSEAGLDSAEIAFKRQMALSLVQRGASIENLAEFLGELGIRVKQPRPVVPPQNNGNGNGQSQAGGRLRDIAHA
jgi:lambda family phage portal protein